MHAPGGERDLATMLASLDVIRRPGEFVVLGDEWADLAKSAHAIVDEEEGRTVVVPVEVAEAAGAPADPRWAWLTLTAHSSLEAVGLTAAFSRALADAAIPSNVLAGAFHDHILVPPDRAEDAVRVMRALRPPA